MAHARALRDIEFFLADHNSCGGLQVRTCPPTVAVGYYLVLTCFCGGFRVKWAMSEQALFNLVWPFQPYTSNYGRFVGFARPNNPPPMGSRYSLFIRDRQTGTDELVSVDVDGNDGNGSSSGAAISADGRFVMFQSTATNLVPGAANGRYWSDVFVHDRQTGTTERVSVASDGTQENVSSHSPAMSANGRFVAFDSFASNLVPRDTNGANDVFVHDRGAPAAVTTTVNFDTPAPPGGPGPLDGVFGGIDFGTGQWAWEGPYGVDATNNIYFADSTGTSRTFAFSPAPRVLNSMSVFSPERGTLTLSDDAGQTCTREVTTGSMQLVAT